MSYPTFIQQSQAASADPAPSGPMEFDHSTTDDVQAAPAGSKEPWVIQVQNNIRNLKPSINEDVEILFLWVAHGSNVSSMNTYTEINDFRFQSVLLYGSSYEYKYAQELTNLLKNDVCRLLLGACPFVPNKQKQIFLPPIQLSVYANETKSDIIEATGLYVIFIAKEKTPTIDDKGKIEKCKIVNNNHIIKIFDHTNMVNLFGDNNPIAYSKILKNTWKLAKDLLPADKINIGIFSCQSSSPSVREAVKNRSIHDMIPRIIHQSPRATILSKEDLEKESSGMFLNFLSFGYNTQDNTIRANWSTLNGLNYQGCAINVLAFYGFIPLPIAQGYATCLMSEGSPTCKIVDQLNKYFAKRNNIAINDTKYVIERTSFSTAANLIAQAIKQNPNEGYVYIFKMTKTQYTDTNPKAYGHTISITVLNNTKTGKKEIYLIDPQLVKANDFTRAKVLLHVVDNNFNIPIVSQNIQNVLQTKEEYQGFNSIDLIFSLSKNKITEYINLPLDTILQPGSQSYHTIIPPCPSTQTAGNRRRRRSIHKKKTKSTKIRRHSAKTRRHSTKTRRHSTKRRRHRRK